MKRNVTIAILLITLLIVSIAGVKGQNGSAGKSDKTVKGTNITRADVFLSNLNWTSATIGWGNIHRDISVEGNTLKLNGIEYQKGIGTHAVSTIEFELGGACSAFHAEVGVDDEVTNSAASVVFMVYADGEKIYQSDVMTSTSTTEVIDVAIEGVDVLKLMVGNANGSNNSDHADWAAARVTVTGTLPPGVVRFRAPLMLNSSCEQLNDIFNWAKDRAYSFVETGEGNNIPSYWAGLPDRPAFYLRDVAHQALGAHFLELDQENYSMLHTFAESSTFGRKYYPLWAFEFDGSIYYLDYHNDTNFVREVPQAFEITKTAYELYRWTGDENYISDTVMVDHYTHAVNGFMEFHDQNDNGIADDNWHQTGNIFLGTATYNEQSTDNFIEAADGMAAQYAAFDAYSGILAARGDTAGAQNWADKAQALRNTFGTAWYQNLQYVRGFKITGSAGMGFAQMHIMFPARYGLTDQAEKNAAALDMLWANYPSIWFVVARSYHPETYFKYNQPERGWAMMNNIFEDNRHNYPEIAFVLIQNCITGIMGVDAFAPQNTVTTTPRLPGEIDWVEADSLKIGQQYIYLKQEKNYKTTLTNKSNNQLTWNAGFYGFYASLLKNGAILPAVQTSLNGCERSFVEVTLAPGETATVEVDTATVSVDKRTLNRMIRVFPNPADNMLYVTARQNIQNIEIYDLAGIKTEYFTVIGNTFTIDVSNYLPGVYLLKIESENGVTVKRFVVR